MSQAFIQPSIANIPESDLVIRLMCDIYWRKYLTGIDGIPEDVEHYLEVPLDGCPGDPKGDIDILLVKCGVPDNSVAIQVKRVKVSHHSFDTSLPTKLAGIKDGIRQTNLLCDLGFSQVYFYVLIVTDSRTQNAEKYGYRGLTQELQTKISAAISVNQLNDRAGLILYTFIQPMDYRPLGVGAGHTHLIRKAIYTLQPIGITEWVRNLHKCLTVKRTPGT